MCGGGGGGVGEDGIDKYTKGNTYVCVYHAY